MSKQILLITVGNDSWEPTQAELDHYLGMFTQATIDPEGSIIVTRSGVTAKVIDSDSYNDITVVSANIDTAIDS